MWWVQRSNICCKKFSNAIAYTITTEKNANYCARKYQNGGDVRNALLNGVIQTYTVPVRLDPDVEGNLDPTLELIWKEDIRLYSKRKEKLAQNLASAYSLIWGQSSKNSQ